MDRNTEIDLVNELLDLSARGSAYLDDSVARNPVSHYFDPHHFALEQEHIFRVLPQPLAHASELPQRNSFLRRKIAGLPVLLTRDSNGVAHAFLNVCRHRGTRLVDATSGCRERFTCPYHAWTWNNRGELLRIPHEAHGFPGLDHQSLGLVRLGCVERYGWIWVHPDPRHAGLDTNAIDDFLSGMGPDLDWIDCAGHEMLYTHEQVSSVNWKILIEGGIEAYHFKMAHRKTIAPYFMDNLSSYQVFGPHLRSILSRISLPDLAQQTEDTWRLRDHAQVLYTILPASQFLVQSDHIAWVQYEAQSASSTLLRINTLVPSDRTSSDADLEHWSKNHEITLTTLGEDFAIGESIQSGLETGANEFLTFGRFEGALSEFSQTVANYLPVK